jgi:hypothetical protein
MNISALSKHGQGASGRRHFHFSTMNQPLASCGRGNGGNQRSLLTFFGSDQSMPRPDHSRSSVSKADSD